MLPWWKVFAQSFLGRYYRVNTRGHAQREFLIRNGFKREKGEMFASRSCYDAALGQTCNTINLIVNRKSVQPKILIEKKGFETSSR